MNERNVMIYNIDEKMKRGVVMSYNNRLKYVRENKSLKQAEVAEMLDIKQQNTVNMSADSGKCPSTILFVFAKSLMFPQTISSAWTAAQPLLQMQAERNIFNYDFIFVNHNEDLRAQ